MAPASLMSRKAAIHPDDLEKLMDGWFRFVASREPGEVEARVRNLRVKQERTQNGQRGGKA